ncbi:MAG: DNA repair protein RecO [Vulcanimicrobiaceae bacterium]
MSAPRSYKTNGVVLRGRQLGEADRIFTLFTDERGKLDAVAKGVRRPKSHLSGRLEFGNECVLSMHRGRSLDVIVAAEIVNAPWERLVDPDRFAVFSLVAEVIDAFSEPDLPMPDVYALLTGAIAGIAASDEPRTLVPRFSLRLLCALGLEPPVDRCVRCSLDFEGTAWLDPEAGGLICGACRERWRDLIEFDAQDLANVVAVGAAKGSTTRPVVRATPHVERAIEILLAHHLGRRPKASIR